MDTTPHSPTDYQLSPARTFAFPHRAFVWDYGLPKEGYVAAQRVGQLNQAGVGHTSPRSLSPSYAGDHVASPVAVVSTASHQAMYMLQACPDALSGKFPLSWSKEDVEVWLRWCVDEFSLSGVELPKFSMNGKALCLLAKDGFQHRAPYAGDVLYDLLQNLLGRGLSSYQSATHMQMRASPPTNGITLARHDLGPTTSGIRNAGGPAPGKGYERDVKSEQEGPSLPHLAETHPSFVYAVTERPGEGSIMSDHHRGGRNGRESPVPLPLNLKISEGTSESSSDSGWSSQDPSEDGVPHHLSAVKVYSPLSDHPQEVVHSGRTPPPGHSWSSPSGNGPSSQEGHHSRPPAAGHSRSPAGLRASPLVHHGRMTSLGHRRSQSDNYCQRLIPLKEESRRASRPEKDKRSSSPPPQFNAYSTSGSTNDPDQDSWIRGPRNGGRVVRSEEVDRSQFSDLSSFANYKLTMASTVDSQRRRQWRMPDTWKQDSHQHAKDERDRSPVGPQRQLEAERTSKRGGEVPQEAVFEGRHYQPRRQSGSGSGKQSPPYESVIISPRRKVTMGAHNDQVMVIRTVEDLPKRSLRGDDASDGRTAHQETLARAVYSLDDIPQLVKARLHKPSPNVAPPFSQLPTQYADCPPPQFDQMSAMEAKPSSKLQSSLMVPSKLGPCRQKGAECRFLWDFLYHLLCEDKYTRYIRWEDKADMIFCIMDPAAVANMWGHQKNRKNMTYEKLSRGLRYYYRRNIICKVPGQKLTYRFLMHPKDIANAPRFSKSQKDVAANDSIEGAATGAATTAAVSPEGMELPDSPRSEKEEDIWSDESALSDATIATTPTGPSETMTTVEMKPDIADIQVVDDGTIKSEINGTQ